MTRTSRQFVDNSHESYKTQVKQKVFNFISLGPCQRHRAAHIESERGNINILYRKWIVTGNEKNVEDGGGGQVAGQQAARVRQHRLGVHQGQHEEGDGPHPMKDLKDENHQKPS